MNAFVWTKIGVESGEGLAQIVRRKEEERASGNGIFWWGIGSSLGAAVRERARAQGGSLPVVFSKMLSPAKIDDVSPEIVWRWQKWEDESGRIHNIPKHVKVVSRGSELKGKHYALVCHSDIPLVLEADGEKFDPTLCRTLRGKAPGSSQVTALLTGPITKHTTGFYQVAFRATLIEPWAPKLLDPVVVSS